jgi:hypothetical protein
MVGRLAEESLPPGTPMEQARWIFAHPHDASFGDGRRVVELLLVGRDPEELSAEELELLARGYNWWGNHEMSFEAAMLAVARNPDSTELIRSAGLYARNAFGVDLQRFVVACDRCVVEGLGPPAVWHLLKAEEYILFATGEAELEDFEWSPGQPILHPERLRLAAQALEAALGCEPRSGDQATAHDWVSLLPGTEHNWNARFAAVLQEPAFKHLTREAGLTNG